MAAEKAVSCAKKIFYRVTFCPLISRSIRKCVKVNIEGQYLLAGVAAAQRERE